MCHRYGRLYCQSCILYLATHKSLKVRRTINLNSWSWVILTLTLWFTRLSILYKGYIAARPLIRKTDDMSDIALTPSQRALLGLGPASAPATPGSAYVTPPRYSRSASRNYSIGSSRAATVGSEGLDRSAGSGGSGTPGFGKSNNWDSPITGSPLARKAMGKRASLSIGQNIGEGSTSSPNGQRNVAVGLSNKFLYQRRVASNGSMTNYV